MMKREALKKCRSQWQWIHTELIKMEAAAEDDELDDVPGFGLFKRIVLRNAGVSEDSHPINSCYLCEYSMVDGVPDCLVCPLKGYAWEQCETDGAYLACENAYDDGWFGDAADYALEICVACERALKDLDNED